MADEYNKTAADITYDHYNRFVISTSQNTPLNDLGEPVLATPVSLNDMFNNRADSDLLQDEHLLADIGYNHSHPLERDEVLESDAVLIASAAGLSEGAIDYADEEELDDGEEDLPLEDVPDADEIEADSPIDPASPPEEIVHGIDLLNGSTGD